MNPIPTNVVQALSLLIAGTAGFTPAVPPTTGLINAAALGLIAMAIMGRRTPAPWTASIFALFGAGATLVAVCLWQAHWAAGAILEAATTTIALGVLGASKQRWEGGPN